MARLGSEGPGVKGYCEFVDGVLGESSGQKLPRQLLGVSAGARD